LLGERRSRNEFLSKKRLRRRGRTRKTHLGEREKGVRRALFSPKPEWIPRRNKGERSGNVVKKEMCSTRKWEGVAKGGRNLLRKAP